MVEEKESIQDVIESKIVRTTFHVSGLPETAKKKLDKFCNEKFGDCRWQMLMYFLEKEDDDTVLDLVVGEVQRAHARIDELEHSSVEKEQKEPKRFGSERK